MFSSLTSALFGERWTADGQRCLHSDQRVFSRVGIDGDRRQEPVSTLFEMLRDDNVRRLCGSFVGANGCSPEKVLVEMSAFYAKNVADRRRSRYAPKIIGGRKAGKCIPGRRAGKDHPRTQCPLRGERSSMHVC